MEVVALSESEIGSARVTSHMYPIAVASANLDQIVNLYVRCQHPNNPYRQTKSIGVCLLAALTTSFSEAIDDIRENSREQRNRSNRRHRGGSSLVQQDLWKD